MVVSDAHKSSVEHYHDIPARIARHLLTSGEDDPTRDDTNVATLRGASPVGVSRRFWTVLGALVLVIFAVTLAVSLVSATHDNSRIDRLKNHGIAVSATVISCIGNLGGSGSNASSYTCVATYAIASANYHEVVGHMSSFAAPGTRVSVVADPSQPSTIELASAVKSSSPSNGVYVAPGLLGVLFVALTVAYLRLLRRPRPSRDQH